eukprot:184224_1
MGSCCPAEEYEGADSPTKEKYKVLFLGSGGCGKSTLFKQLRKLYGEGLTVKDKKDARHGIAAFVIETMKTLLECQEYKIEELSEDAQKAAKYITNLAAPNSNSILNEEIATNITILWNEEKIKLIFDETAKLHLNGPCAYFFDAMDRVSDPNFEPSDKDILMQRRPTTGLIEQVIAKTDYEDVKFQMVDVGGQNNERRKWIHQFEHVAAVIYVISLASYDEPLYEDETINSLHDSIALFAKTVNDHWFEKKSFFLLFNKKDIFEQKIINKSLSECFENHPDINDYDENEYFNECKSDDDKIKKNKDFIKNIYFRQIQEKQHDKEKK